MTRSRFADYTFLAGLLLLAASLPLSVFGMSLAQFVMAGAWVLTGDVWKKLRAAFSDRLILILAGVYGMHALGLLYSMDLDYALQDLRIKLPLLLLPLLLGTAPAYVCRHAALALPVLVAAVFASTVVSTGVLYGLFPPGDRITDTREIAVFISHIRLSLLICFSLFVLAWYTRTMGKMAVRIACVLLMAWFIFFLYKLESMTGFAVLFIAASALGLRSAGTYGMNRRAVITTTAVLAAGGFLLIRHEASTVYSDKPIDFSTLESRTVNGNAYRHYTDRKEQENGYRVWIYVCEPELKEAWNRRSGLDYDGRDRMGHELKYTLVRYLASKGLRKDAAGMNELSDAEIHAVENGIANTGYREMGSLRQRIRKSIKEYYLYRDGANPTGSSLMQRLEYWKAGWHIFMNHWITGVGTGDVQSAFDETYRRSGTRLAPEQWHRAHNQFLTMGIAFGVAGLAYFVFSLVYPLNRRPAGRRFLYIAFWWIAVLSMLTEDTLETQAGATFYAFLNGFLLFLHGRGPDSPPARMP